MKDECKILLVEDEPVVVESASRILGSEGFPVDHVSDAQQAMEKLHQCQYQLIISDLMLPGISGIEIIEKVKLIKPEIPIIIITGYANIESAIKSFKVGAFDFLPKPFDFEELIAVVFRCINYSQMNKISHDRKVKILSIDGSENQPNELEQYYFLGEHSWAKVERDGVAAIGVAETFQGTMGDISRIEMPLLKTEVWQGNLCARIIAKNSLAHVVWAPLSGQVIGVNAELEKRADLINKDPFGKGWLFRIVPTNLANELENLDLIK